MKLTLTLLWLAVVGWLLLAFTSCTLTVAADGAKSFSVDAEAIRILSVK